MRTLLLLVLLATPLLPAEDSKDSKGARDTKDQAAVRADHRHRRARLGGISIGAGFAYFSRPYYYPWFGSPFYYGYDPFFYHPYYFTGFARGPRMGEIKLLTDNKSAEVYLDGAYAGVAGDLKNMWLEPGAYNLEIRGDHGSFQRRVYVLSGKTLRIRP